MEPKKYISTLKRTVHGGPDFEELEHLGLKPEELMDFSVNVNPFGPTKEVIEAISEVSPECYPDPKSLSLCRAISSNAGVLPAQVLPTNGLSELIWLVGLAYLGEGDDVLIIGPTFGEYADAAGVVGARVNYWEAAQETDFLPEIDQITARIKQIAPKIVFLCNPNNPTGRYLNVDEVKAVMDSSGDGVLVLDEAYVPFVDCAWPSAPLIDGAGTIVMRSLTKDCALAGIRIGYAMAHHSIIQALAKVQPAWSVNAIAQAAGIAALSSDGQLEKCLREIRAAKEYLFRSFSELGFRVIPSSAHYFLIEVGDAEAFRKKLLARKFLVRDCTSFGLPGFIRISPRTMEECKLLVDTVSALPRPPGPNG